MTPTRSVGPCGMWVVSILIIRVPFSEPGQVRGRRETLMEL